MPPDSMQFLLIEDDESLIQLLSTVLNTQNHGVVVARDGAEGKLMAESQFYDLILLDVGLPKIDGITLCRQLRQQGNLAPIILLTVRNSHTDNLMGLEAGADDYIVKPFNLNILLARIQALLRREYRSFRSEKPQFYDSEHNFSLELTQIWERTKETTFSRIQDLLDVLQSLEKGELDDTLRERTKRNVHKLAGSLGTFGFPEGSTIAQKLEQIFMEVTEVDSCLEKSRPLILELQQVVMATDRALLGQEPKGSLTPPTGIVSNHFQPLDNLHNPIPLSGSHQSVINGLKAADYILLADNDQLFTKTLAREAISWKFTVKVVRTARELCKLIYQSPPTVLLLNLEVIAHLEDWQEFQRILKRSTSSLSIIVLSEREGLVNRLKAIQLNSDVFLQKPATPSQVFAAVSRAIGFYEWKVKVLVVDDDTKMTELLKGLLETINFQVEVLTDPTDFWNHLGKIQPDLLILDVEMPSLDGICLCNMIRKDFQWSWLPILFITAHDDIDTLQEAFSNGADDFITKPINPDALINRVLNRWKRSQLYRNQMETDFLTGIANRNGGSRSFSHLLQLALQSQQPLCLAILDLDYFKHINDRYGHEEGDRVLREFGEFLKKHCRAGDMLARWGGEEFIIGMLGLSREGGAKRMNEIREEWYALEFTTTQGEPFHVSFSGGVSQYALDGSDFQMLYRTADAAMYQAKAAGRNLVLPAH